MIELDLKSILFGIALFASGYFGAWLGSTDNITTRFLDRIFRKNK